MEGTWRGIRRSAIEPPALRSTASFHRHGRRMPAIKRNIPPKCKLHMDAAAFPLRSCVYWRKSLKTTLPCQKGGFERARGNLPGRCPDTKFVAIEVDELGPFAPWFG